MSSTKDLPTRFDLAEANAWAKELFNESDRGAVLIGSAYLEQMVERLLRAKMIGNSKVVDGLFEPHSALSTFASCTGLVYALGWIGSQMHADLSAIRKIRNDFAHSALPLTLEDPSARDRCKNLQVLKFEPQRELKTAKDHFVVAVFFLVLQLTKLLQEASKPTPAHDPVVKPITERLAGSGSERWGAEV
ncbi:MAG TPA: MltR family transcriptional regulator [Terriglobia bacterium]|nr:MltR family transcriptional regulator [Terriglobia bacterium]